MGGTSGNERSGSRTVVRYRAEISRAIPTIPRRSGRLDVILRENTVSGNPTNGARSAPSGRSEGRSQIPADFPSSPSSFWERSIPSLFTPRIVATESSPPGRRAPGRARGKRPPARALSAPHTTVRWSVPVSTWHRERFLAFGWGSTATTRATTTPSASRDSIRSTSSPATVSRSASASRGTSGRSTYSETQFRDARTSPPSPYRPTMPR